MADVHTKEQRSKNMQRIKSKDTKIERILGRALWSRGYRYRKNYKNAPGKPDFVFVRYRIPIFCDSEFFHGKDWPDLKSRLQRGDNADFWIKKISRNIERDKKVNAELRKAGWTVLRFWGEDIKKKTDSCVQKIEKAIKKSNKP